MLNVFNKLNDNGKDKVIDYAQMVYITNQDKTRTKQPQNQAEHNNKNPL